MIDIENCPKCGSKLIKGTYDICPESLLESALLYGASAPHHLWFRSNGEENPEREFCLNYAEPNKGAKCPTCGLMLIDPPSKQHPTELPEFPSIAGKGV